MTIQEQIEQARIKNKQTYEDLERKTEIHQANISKMLKDASRDPKLGSIEKLCGAVGLELTTRKARKSTNTDK